MTEPAEKYARTVATLRAAGCVYAEDEARLLLEDGRELDELVARRVGGEPLEWVLGWVQFGEGLRLVLHPGVFVPRTRTVDLALAASALLPADGTAADLCCGSGAITAYLHLRMPESRLYAADIDPTALACAQENLPFATVLEGDLFAALPRSVRGTLDVIVANTPYVPSDEVALLPPEAREHEPLHTLDGGPDGLDLLRRIAAEATTWLRPGGTVLIEINERQFPAARDAFEAAGLIVSGAESDDGTAVIQGKFAELSPVSSR